MSGQPPRGVFTTDAALVIRVWDDWLAGATGQPADAVRGRSIEEVVPDLRARGLLRYFEEALAAGTVQVLAPAFHHYLIPCEPQAASAHFSRMQQRVTIGPLREGDRIVGTLTTIEDVTERLDGERDLADALNSADPQARRAGEEALAARQSEAPEALRPLLAEEDWKVRQAGVRELVRNGDAAFIHSVIAVVRDEHRNFSVLSSALKLLALTDVAVVDPLATLLQHEDVDLRIQAALALGDQQDAAAVAPLVAALDDPDLNVRFHVIESLGRLRAASAVEALLDVIASREFFLAFAAIDALALIGDRSVAARLVPLLAEEMLQAPIIDALAGLGEDDVVDPLVDTLNGAATNATPVADALATIAARMEQRYGTGSQVEDAVRGRLSPSGVQHLLEALGRAAGPQLASVVRVLGWLNLPEVDRALSRLLAEPTARTAVLEAFARHGSRVVPLLVEHLGSEDESTRLAAIAALARVGDRRATAALVAGLGDDSRILVAIAGALAKIADPAAFEPLVALVSHRDAAVRMAAIGALNSIGHPEMPQRVAALLGDADARTRESAVRIAGYFGYRETADRLLAAALADPDELVRRAALEQLPYLDDERAAPTLVSALGSDSARTRATAVRALARLDGDEAATALRGALDDSDSWVRYHAARAVGERHDAAALGTLVRLVDHDSATPVRIAAVEAAGRFTPDVSGHLERWAADGEHDVAAAALQALGRAADDTTLHTLLESLRSEHVPRRLAALRGLAAHASERALATLEWTASADRDEAIVTAAIEALSTAATAGRETSGAALDALLALLADARCREMVLTVIRRLPPALIPPVRQGLDHASLAVRLGTVEVLTRFRHPEATAGLETALDSPSAEVREAAALGLARVGAPASAARLLRLASHDPSKAVRRAAAGGLARLRPPDGRERRD